MCTSRPGSTWFVREPARHAVSSSGSRGRRAQAGDLHRHHLGTRMRDARREVSLYHGSLPEATSAALAAQLLGHLTRPSEAAIRAE